MLNNKIIFQDGYGGQTLIFNKNMMFIHLKNIYEIKQYEEYVKKYENMIEKII